MKNSIVLVFVALLVFCSACSTQPKPYYMTKTGKKKQKYYNDIQFGKNAHPKKTW